MIAQFERMYICVFFTSFFQTATHLPTVPLHTQTCPRYTNMYTHTHTRKRTHAHTHTYRLSLYHLQHWVLISPIVFTKHVYVYECAHLHVCTHTHTHGLACTSCSDFGFLFLTLFLQSVHVHECTYTPVCTLAFLCK